MFFSKQTLIHESRASENGQKRSLGKEKTQQRDSDNEDDRQNLLEIRIDGDYAGFDGKTFTMNQQSKNTTQLFHLKPLTAQHLGAISDWYQDVDELALIESNLPLPINSQSLEKFWQRDLEQKEPRTSYVYSICNEQGVPVGFTGLQDINFTYGSGVVFVFVRKESRRRGLALRSIALMLDMACDQLRLHRITTYVHSDNTPSMSLINRIGFTHEGRMREACFFNGRFSDVNVVSMLAHEWQGYRVSLSEGLDSTTSLSIGDDENTRWTWPLK